LRQLDALKKRHMATTGNKGTTPATAEAGSNPLTQNALNLPNIITISRLVLAFVLFGLIWYEGLWITSAIVFVIAAATDALDGFIARRYGMVTMLGRILDPFVDKIIICGAFVFLMTHPDSGVNAWMTIAVIGREMFVTGLRSFLEQMGKDFSASMSGKIKMVLQCLAVVLSLVSMSPQFRDSQPFLWFRDITLWVTVAFTVYSGYIYIQRAAQLLKPAKS
jgi:CDP-diacylglycerol---glycerol-3-phosphate 3-phosphatidyltransferase